MKRPFGPTSALARETLRRGIGRVREAGPLLRKGRLAGLGLLGLLIGLCGAGESGRGVQGLKQR
eukprot:gene17370-23993_t